MTPYSQATLDPYAELGVPRDASHQAIKQAYRRIALESHPDRLLTNDPATADRFRRASQAYALLRDPERRTLFDSTGRWENDSWSPAELDAQLFAALEIFARDFGTAVEIQPAEASTPTHTAGITVAVDVSYEDVERGARRCMPAPCARCAGSGAREGSAHVRCTSCGGSGRLRHVESSFLGPRIHTETCESCQGSGRRPLLVCPGCQGTGRAGDDATVEVIIPRGTADGDSLVTLNGNGSRFVARLQDDQRWAREGADLYATGRIPYDIAVLGGAAVIELPGRTHHIDVAPGTASGQRVRIPDHGLPRRDGGGRGDLILTLHIAVPQRIGTMERLLLLARRGQATALDGTGLFARVARSHAQARAWANEQWQQWRAHHHKSSLLRIEKAATALRSAAALLSDTEQRLGPLLEQAFPMIAPEAVVARKRLDTPHLHNAALGALIVDLVLVTILGAGLWAGAAYATPAIAAAGSDAWWAILRHIHPSAYVIVPLLTGFSAGAVRVLTDNKVMHRAAAVPLAFALAFSAAAAGSAMYAIALLMLPEAHPVAAVVSALLGIGVAVAPILVFMLGEAIIREARNAAIESLERTDRSALRNYDVAAARLATHLEATERAFRQLLTQADDARYPLTSLLNSASDTLAGDRQRRPGSTSLLAACSLAAAVLLTALWAAASTLATTAAFVLLPDVAVYFRILLAAAVAGLCALGSILPAALLERHRTKEFTTAVATLVTTVAIAGVLATGRSSEGPAAGWLLAAGAVGAVALSFRLPESVRAAATALRIVAGSLWAAVLWPVALVVSVRRGRRA